MEDKTNIKFTCAYLSFLNTFALETNKDINRHEAVEKLKNKGVEAKSIDKHLKDFETAEKFLLSEGIRQQFFRLSIGGFIVSLAQKDEKCPVNSQIEVDVFLTIYREFGIGALLFNVHLENYTVDRLVFLIQCFQDRFKIHVKGPNVIKLHSNNIFIGNILVEYVKKISAAFGLEPETPHIFKSRCVEIRGLSNSEIPDAQGLLDRFPRQIYGLLTTDEGWRSVPENVAIERTNMKWRTRNFFCAVPWRLCVLFINLTGGDTHRKYLEYQNLLCNKFGYPIEEYHKSTPTIAGLNHGPLLNLEIASIQYYMLDRVLSKVTKSKRKGIRGFLAQREELIKALSKLAQVKIQEIGILGQNIGKTMGIENKIEEVTKRLEETERTLDIKYNKRINLLMIILAILGLIFAVDPAIEGIKQLFSLIYSLLSGLF